ncbi:hypothetical protein KSC_053300 [Ktedonobacter sp. SOSP1-52]|uniref:hypothetical protein n=1 Tax=Ktedonobacter sp. SOSP1-52 TaxID=2778366 RepID=UPI001915E451|nr:hypothetical protein [Ktedonobacter sp. SOSP1-52]GHO66438.1 hypothetical protein KSC_053300 [Ktedonobacter sp. SOSP1-52]
MIRCNRCGNVSPASAGQCQMCGAPLASSVENGQPLENWQTGNMVPGRSGQGQQELPAWLESLRAGEMSAAPPKSPANFTAGDLVEEGSLPTWMRSERGETGEVPLRPSGFSAATTGEGGMPKQGFDANSLIDENSLPSWMHEGKKNESAPLPQGFNASSLVDSEALPEWMRQIHPQAQASSPMTPTQQPAPAMPNIAQTPQPASMPPMPAVPEPFTQAPSPFNSTQNAAAEVNSGAFSANSLIDPQALPSWMKENEAGGAQNPASAQSFQPGFAASSLIDANALPGWMRENEQGAPSQSNPAANAGGAISASSFVDVNALPSWMREGEGYAQGGVSTGSQSANQASMRVPSRPRSEVSSTEGSEVAANVFASMLGVASAAPQFPGQPPMQPQQPQQLQPGSAPMSNGSPFMGGAPGVQGPASMGMPQGPTSSPMPQPGGYAGSGSLPGGMQGAMPGMMGQPPQPQPGQSMSGIYNNPYAYGNAPAANPNPYSMGGNSPMPMGGMGQMPNNTNNMPGAMPSQSGIGPMAEQSRLESQKPAKRGLFNAIRELFFR